MIPYCLKALRKIGNVLSFRGRLRAPQIILRRLFRFAQSEIWVSDFDGKFQMCLRLSEHMQRRIFWMGYYSTEIAALLKKELQSEMVVVDVGANIGEITLVAAQCVGAQGKVIAFEPVTTIAEKLTRHVQINNLNHVVIIKEALGKEAGGQIPIYISCGQDVSDEHQGLASLYGAELGEEPIEYVKINTLDSAVNSLSLARLDLIKIDIEGGELACLQGAKEVLRRFKPMLIIEVQEFSAQQAGWKVKELFEYLEGFGYEFFTIEKKGRLSIFNPSSMTDFQNVFCKFCDK